LHEHYIPVTKIHQQIAQYQNKPNSKRKLKKNEIKERNRTRIKRVRVAPQVEHLARFSAMVLPQVEHRVMCLQLLP
jgi:hypothetical protein